MTNSNAELIENLKKLERARSRAFGAVNDWELTQIKDAIKALESQPFDVLQYLRDGEELIDETGTRIKFINDHVMVWGPTFNVWNTAAFGHSSFIEEHWQPYHSPPVEGTLAWAKVQDCRVFLESEGKDFWVNFVTGEEWYPGAINTITEYMNINNRYSTGWSLYVEPREVGLYSGILEAGEEVDGFRWNGTHWLHGDIHAVVRDDDFHWISDKRIDLDAPEEGV